MSANSGRLPSAHPTVPAAASTSTRSTRAAPKHGAKRLDLQGLRAIAVLLVALNHARIPFLSGGYIGVDVFFVLSGFFITGLLLREGFGNQDGLGRISMRNFYARRARRILPAACLTLLVTSLAVYFVYDLMGADFLATKTTLEDAFSAALFFANFHFISTANNYFAQATTTMPSPFQHFWSLSVEEQFYVVWPSLLALTFYGCRRWIRLPVRKHHSSVEQGVIGRSGQAVIEHQRRQATWIIGILIAAVSIGSLVWSIQATGANPQAAYFSTPVRVWEFGIGAGLSLLAARPRKLPKRVVALLGWIGIAMIVIAAVIFSSITVFPGYTALLPVIGAGLVILAGMDPIKLSVGRLLAWRPLTVIGDRSYAFYLWHYPVLIITWQAVGRVLPAGDNIALLVGAFALSSVTYALYENPLRFASWMGGWRIALMAPVATGLAVLAAVVPIAVFNSALSSAAIVSRSASIAQLKPAPGQPDPVSLTDATPIPEVVTAVRLAEQHAALPQAIVPSLSELEQENSHISYDTPSGCTPAFGPGVSAHVCRLGDPTSKTIVAVIGDSHSGMWIPALVADGRAQGFAVVPLGKPGCLLTAIGKNRSGWPCASWYHWALGQDHQLHPLATIVEFQMGPDQQAHPTTAASDLQAVLGSVTNAVLLVDPPDQTQQPSTCITGSGADMEHCSSPVGTTYRPLMDDLSKMAAQEHYPAIPTLQWFCADNICPMVINHTLTTRDKSHFTMEYSAELAPVLGSELKPILKKLASHETGRSGS
jgi:peptidoglycan/LPS O-acetylase OafA/YrhL